MILLSGRLFFYPQILHIGPAEHDVFVNCVRRWDLLRRVCHPPFSTEGCDIFERNGRCLGIDFMKNTDIADASLACVFSYTDAGYNTEYHSWKQGISSLCNQHTLGQHSAACSVPPTNPMNSVIVVECYAQLGQLAASSTV